MTAPTPPSSAIAGGTMNEQESRESLGRTIARYASECARLRAALAEAEGRDAAMREDATTFTAQDVRDVYNYGCWDGNCNRPSPALRQRYDDVMRRLRLSEDAARRSAPGERTP